MIRVFPRGVRGIALVLGVVAGIASCKPNTRDNPDVCDPGPNSTDKCADGFRCSDEHKCMPVPDGSADVGGAVGSGGIVGSGGSSSGGAGGRETGSGGDAGSTAGGPGGGAGAGGAAGAAGGGVGGAGGGPGGAGGSGPECTEDAGGGAGGGTVGPKPCGVDKPFCLQGTCVGCKGDGDCKNTTPICSSQKTCVSCVGVTTNPCASHMGTPVCATTGAMTGACVNCAMSTDCKDSKAPICSSMNLCVSCEKAEGDKSCVALNKQLPFCAATGSQPGICVECKTSTDCEAASNKPFCASGTCVSCDKAVAPDTCQSRVSGKPACGAAGACVQCVKNQDCTMKNAPVCSTANTCGPCAGDNDCAGRAGPVVCFTNDGHCAIESETIYVQPTACSDVSGAMGGTSTMPYCSLGPVPGAVTPMRTLVVVRGAVNSASASFGAGAPQLWIVGQQSAVIGGVNTGIHLTSGDTSVRDLAVSSTLAIGIEADLGSTLRLQHVNVNKNSGGGILLNGAGFDIQNTIVSENGPGMDAMGTTWGGIRIKDPPTAGPKQLKNVSIQANKQVGLSCSAGITGTAVLVSGSVGGVDITTSCGVTSCGTATATCGAQ